ncbi:hypothetical protein ABEB36_014444 [Hypothenemus hampei]|uniref:Uncharacterized protein n=1 Tax=Hypothenemus hampei TaxID=57062 RepID=A0ABD1E4K2_HYPHA
MPKPLSRASKELVASLIRYFEKEKDAGGPLLPLTAVRERVATALNLNISTVSTISKAVKNNEVLSSPKKKKPRPKTVTNRNTLDETAVRNVIYEMYEVKMWREALAKVTGETWKKCIDHTDLEIMKWYNREQIMDTADTTPLIINFDDNDDESDEWASDS